MYSFFVREPSTTLGSLFLNVVKDWFISLKLIAGLFLPSFFFTTKILLRNWTFCEQTCLTISLFKIFSTLFKILFISNKIVAFCCIEKFIPFGPYFCFGLQREGIWYPLTFRKILWSFACFSQLSRKSTKLAASGTVAVIRQQNNFFTNVCADDNYFTGMNCGISFNRRLLFWLPWFLNCHLL